MTLDNDYAYIDVFINFLERIINIIVGVFERIKEKASGNIKTGDLYDETTTTAPATETTTAAG